MDLLQIVSVQHGDVVDAVCDVLVLKHAQGFYGADGVVANRLAVTQPGLMGLSLPPDKYKLLPTEGTISAEHALFLGVVQLYRFDYGQIRSFARYALKILQKEQPHVGTIAMTMHGIGYGLDEQEAFLAQLAGIQDACQAGAVPASLKKIIFVERNKGRATRLKEILKEQFAAPPINAGTASEQKPHVFVAMPFATEFEDVYRFGIQGPVNEAGFLCERVDMAHFTGDILERIKTRIETAALVVADLTGAPGPDVRREGASVPVLQKHLGAMREAHPRPRPEPSRVIPDPSFSVLVSPLLGLGDDPEGFAHKFQTFLNVLVPVVPVVRSGKLGVLVGNFKCV
jgi:hypothetical protein